MRDTPEPTGQHFAPIDEAHGGVSGGSEGGGARKWLLVVVAVAVVATLGGALFAGNDDETDDDPAAADGREQSEVDPRPMDGQAPSEEGLTDEAQYEMAHDQVTVLGDGDFVVRYLAVTDGASMNVTYPALGVGVEQELGVSSPWALELRGDIYEDVTGSNVMVSPRGPQVVGCRMYFDGELVAENEAGPGDDSAHCTTNWFDFDEMPSAAE